MGKEEKGMKIKKVIASFLSVAMLVGASVASFAETSTETINRVTLNSVGISDAIKDKIQITSNGDKIKSGYTLSVMDLEDSGVLANKSNITFYYSSDNENWNEISNAGEVYTITNDMADKYICAVLMDNQAKKYVSNTVQVGNNLKHLLSWGNAVPGAVEKSVDTNKVVFIDENNNKSKELLLLHRGEEKTFFAMPAVSGFNIYDDNTAQTQIISASDPKSIIYKMNQENYITTNIMPISMQKYLRTTNWETEAGSSNLDTTRSNMKNDTVTTAKVAPLSASEYYTYGNIIGYNDVNGIMLRTPTSSVTSASAGKFETVLDSGTMQYQNSYSTFYAMVPVFWVSNDIFKEIKAESAGTEVIKAILAAGNENGLYTTDEWNSFQFGDISGTEEVKLDIKSNGSDRIKSGYILTATDKDSSSNIIESAETIAYFTSVDGESWEMASTAEEGAKFVLLNSHANKYVIAAAKMRDGTKYISNSLLVGENLEPSPGVWNQAPAGMKEYADKTDRLYLDAEGLNGIGYTMLDSDENSVLLLSDSLDQKATYVNPEDPNGFYQIYDSTDENSVAYYINQDKFITNNIVPSGYEQYVNTTFWETEAGCKDVMRNDTVDASKVALPSMTELYKYANKIGYRDGSAIRTRTPVNSEDSAGYFKFLLPSGGMQYLAPTSTFYQFRVETNINKELYKYVKLDAINSGIDALKTIDLPGMLDIEQAKGLGYSDEELIKLGYFENRIYTYLTNISLSGNNLIIDVATSNPKEDINAKMICVVFDSDNRLKLVKDADVTVLHGESNIEKTIELSNDIAETDKISFYLWKDTQNISPISAKIFNAEKNMISVSTLAAAESIPYNSEIFEYNGRWQEDTTNNCMVSNWAYPYIDFSVKATNLVINFADSNAKAIKIYVNGKEVWADAQSNASKKTALDISEYLSSGVSNVRVLNNAEILQMNFKGITVNNGAEVLNPKKSNGNLLFIGDSISSASYSYTFTIPSALGMDNARISKSGIAFLDGNYAGAVKSGVLGMQTKFKHMQTLDKGNDAYDFSNDDKYDIIFVNIGTNDVYMSQDGTVNNIEKFKTDYKSFIGFLTDTYKKSKIVVIKPVRKSIFWAYDKNNKTNAYYRGITFDSIGESIQNGEYGQNVYYVDTTDWDIDINDIDSIHPTVAGHEQIKSKLITFLTEKELIK